MELASQFEIPFYFMSESGKLVAVSFVCIFTFSYVGFIRNSFSCIILVKRKSETKITKPKKSETQNKGTFYHCLLSYANLAVK